MIKVQIVRENQNFKSLEVKGHADSGPFGQDLVCAAVSAVITGGFNNLHTVKDFNIILEEGYASLEVINKISSHDEIVIETIICGLSTIQESYSEFIQIKNL